MIGEFVSLRADVEMLKSAFGDAIRIGPVAALDAVKGYRIEIGQNDDGPVLSPWYPHPETSKTSVPLKLRQIVGMVNPTGDPRQGMLIRGGHSDEHPSPNINMDANVFADAGVRIEIVDGGVVVTAAAHVTVNAPSVALGGEGGEKVARVGDLVHVKSGSSSGMWPIVTGSSVVSAVD